MGNVFRFDDVSAGPKSKGLGDGAAAFAEPNRHKTFAAAVGTHDDCVAIFEEAARLPRGERQRPPAAGGDLEQAAEAVIDGRRHRASPEQIPRSEEHTSELQSLTNLVCRLLLEKKKTNDSASTTYQYPNRATSL